MDKNPSYKELESKELERRPIGSEKEALEQNEAEGLLVIQRDLAVIPIVYKGQVIGALNLASHTNDALSINERDAMEAIASQVGAFS